MTEKKPYIELLKDPRWQKKRLEIMNRDEFMCQSCYNKELTLHVHHIAYDSGLPWETHNDKLITLCEECHKHETSCSRDMIDQMVAILKHEGAMCGDFYGIANAFAGIGRQFFKWELNLSILKHAIQTPEVWKMAHDSFMESIGKTETKTINQDT